MKTLNNNTAKIRMRIVKKTNNIGMVKYLAQVRFLFIWWNFHIYNGEILYYGSYDSLEGAQEGINMMLLVKQRKNKSSSIVVREFTNKQK